MLPFHNAAREDFLADNAMILKKLHTDVEMVGNIGHYIIEGGGKRLRPLVVLLSSLSCGYQGKDHVSLATIIEFIHTATLLHDDVVDNSDMRRGRKTANSEWGNSPSVLVGDFLYSRAFQMLVALNQMPVMGILADTTNTIAEGEVEQLINAGDPDISEDHYLRVILKKTAILFEAATHSGAVLAGAPAEKVEALRLYGRHLGMAFQIQDDVLDYAGDSEQLGKNVGDDLAEGKPTLPLIHAMAHGNKEDSALIREAISHKQVDRLQEIVKIVNLTGSLQYTQELAQQHVDKALLSLDTLDESPYRQAMRELATFSLTRTY